MRPIPVLMYQHVNHHKGDAATVTPEVFERQMRHLHESGYRTLTIDELLSYQKGEVSFRGRAVLITFDDGWLDNYLYAYPVLKRYGINAAVFLVTDWVERASGRKEQFQKSIPRDAESKDLIQKGEHYRVVVNWGLVREMMNSGLVEFYSHTKSHARCEALSEGQLTEELMGSKHTVEDRLGRACPYLCWPYGSFSVPAVGAARAVGYEALFTAENGVVKVGSDPFGIARVMVKNRVQWFKDRMRICSSGLLSAVYLNLKSR